jgi:2'-5' RNA ligase
VRCFVALDPPPEVRARVAALIERVRRATPRTDVRWADADTLHVTLKFLGEVADDRVPAVGDALARVAAAHAPLALVVAGAGTFPGSGRPRVLHVRIAGDAAGLAALARAVDASLAALGFAAETRPFQAHLTVGRVRSPRGAGRLAAALGAEAGAPLGAWTAEAVVLYQSRLHPAGAVHTPLGRFPLGGPGDP